MVAVTGMNAAPAVYDNRWSKGTNDFDHVLQDFVAPDFFSFFGSLGVTKILGASEEEFHAVTASRGKQFLGADKAELRGLLRPEIILPAFAASKGEERDIRMKAPGEIGEHGSRLVIRMRSDVQDASGYTGVFDGLHGFGHAWTGAWSWRKLGFGRRCENGSKQKE